MNIDDPFASDLSNFDSIVAALETNVDKHKHTTINDINHSFNDNKLSSITSRNKNIAVNMPSSASNGTNSPLLFSANANKEQITQTNNDLGNVHFLPTSSQMPAAVHGRRAQMSTSVDITSQNKNLASATTNTLTAAITNTMIAKNSNGANATTINNNNITNSSNNDDDDPLAWLNDGTDSQKENNITNNKQLLDGRERANANKAPVTNTNSNNVTNNNTDKDADDFLAFLEVEPVASIPTNANYNKLRDSTDKQLYTNKTNESANLMPWETKVKGSETQFRPNNDQENEDRNKRENELRELRATLAALNAEIEQREQAISNKQMKEDAALLELEVKICEKEKALTEEMNKAQEAREESERHVTCRKREISERLENELSNQVTQIRHENETRYHRQLETLANDLSKCNNWIAKLEEERDLITQHSPLSTQGVMLTLHKTLTNDEHVERKPLAKTNFVERTAYTDDVANANATNNLSNNESSLHQFSNEPPNVVNDSNNGISNNINEIKNVFVAASKDAVNSKTRKLDRAIEVIVSLLTNYCDQRMNVMRESTVDFIHSETLNESNTIHKTRATAIREECNKRKSMLDKDITETISEHRAFMKERQERNEITLQKLQHKTQTAITELVKRQETEQMELWCKFNDKVADLTSHFSITAMEAASLFDAKAAQMLLSQKSATASEQGKLEKRFELEERVQRQLFESEEEALQEQLTRLKQLSETQASQRLTSMHDEISKSRSFLQSLQRQLESMSVEVEKKINESYSRQYYSSKSTHSNLEKELNRNRQSSVILDNSYGNRRDDISTVLVNKELDERHHVNLSLLNEIRGRYDALIKQKVDIHNVQLRLLHTIDEECVQMFQSRLAAQNTAESEINFIRTTWEKAYLQQLSMPFKLDVPVIISADKPLPVLEHHDLSDGACANLLTYNNENKSNNRYAHLPVTTASETVHAPVTTYSPPALMTATALLEAIVKQLEQSTAQQRNCRSEIAAHVKEQVTALKSLETRNSHLHRSWLALLEQLQELDRKRECVYEQRTSIQVEAVKANCKEDMMKEIQLELQERRMEIAQRLALCTREKEITQKQFAKEIAQLRHTQHALLREINKKANGSTNSVLPLQWSELVNLMRSKHHDQHFNCYDKLREEHLREASLPSSALLPLPAAPTYEQHQLETHNEKEDNENDHKHTREEHYTSSKQLHRNNAHSLVNNYVRLSQRQHKHEEEYEEEEEEQEENKHQVRPNENESKRKNNDIAAKRKMYYIINNSNINNSDNKRLQAFQFENGNSSIRRESKLKERVNEHHSNTTSFTLHKFRGHSPQSSSTTVMSATLFSASASSIDTIATPPATALAHYHQHNSVKNVYNNNNDNNNNDNNINDNNNQATRHDSTIEHAHVSGHKLRNNLQPRAASVRSRGNNNDESLCSSSSVYKATSFTDLFPLADSTNTSMCTIHE